MAQLFCFLGVNRRRSTQRMIEKLKLRLFSLEYLVLVIVSVWIDSVSPSLLDMFHHVKLSLIYFIVNLPHTVPPCNQELAYFHAVVLCPQFLKLGTGCFPEDLLP